MGIADKDIAKCVPELMMPRAILEARAYLLIYIGIIAVAMITHTWLPILLLLLPRIMGGPMHGVILATQHVGLAQDIKDHRHTTRTMKINPVLRILYWNMNYHIEHHNVSQCAIS